MLAHVAHNYVFIMCGENFSPASPCFLIRFDTRMLQDRCCFIIPLRGQAASHSVTHQGISGCCTRKYRRITLIPKSHSLGIPPVFYIVVVTKDQGLLASSQLPHYRCHPKDQRAHDRQDENITHIYLNFVLRKQYCVMTDPRSFFHAHLGQLRSNVYILLLNLYIHEVK